MKKFTITWPVITFVSAMNLIGDPLVASKQDSSQVKEIQFWPPEEVNDIYREASHEFLGKNDSYCEGQVSISLENDLKYLENIAHSIDIEEIKLELKLKNVNRWINGQKNANFWDPVIWNIEEHDLKILTSEILNRQTLTFKFETSNYGNYWHVKIWNTNLPENHTIGFETTASFKSLLGVKGLIFEYIMGNFTAKIKYKYLIDKTTDDNLEHEKEKLNEFIQHQLSEAWDLELTNLNRVRDVFPLIEKKIKSAISGIDHIIKIKLDDEEKPERFLEESENSIKIKIFFLDKEITSENKLTVKLKNIKQIKNYKELRGIISFLDDHDWKINLEDISEGKYSNFEHQNIYEIATKTNRIFTELIHTFHLIEYNDAYNWYEEIEEKLNNNLIHSSHYDNHKKQISTKLYTKTNYYDYKKIYIGEIKYY